MSFWTDIARTTDQPRAADALYVQFPGRDLFLVVEAGEPTSSGAQLVPMAAGAIVTGVAASNATSAPRIIDQALESANRTIADAKRFNPLVADILVSVAVVLRDEQGLHYATAGSNTIYLRAGGTCRRLNEPESEARHLVSEGITADPLPGGGEESSRPSVGLGLPPDVFRIRQSGSLMEPDDYLLVIIGGRAASRLGPVHIETTSPVGDASRTAERLLRQSGVRPQDGSAVCAAHRAHDVIIGGNGLPPQQLATDVEPIHIPWRAIGGALALIVLVALAFHFFGNGMGGDKPRDPVLSPTTLLTPKEGKDALPRRPLAIDVGPVDTGIHALDFDSRDAGPDGDAATGPSNDARSTRQDVVVAREPSAREKEKARLRREARAKRRAERRRKKREEREREEAAQRDAVEPDAVPAAFSADIIQVIDFTKPEPDARGEDAGPRKRAFPTAKLDLPDVVTSSSSAESTDSGEQPASIAIDASGRAGNAPSDAEVQL